MKAKKLFEGLTFLLIGAMLLANTLEILDWSVWSNLFKLWPLLIISFGLSMIFREKGLSFIGPLVIFLGIITGVGASYMGINFEGEIVKEVKTLSREIVMEVGKVPETKPIAEIETSPDTNTTPETKVALETELYPEIGKASIGLNLDVGKLTLSESTPLLYECISEYRYKEFEPFEKFSNIEKEADILIFHSPVTQKRISNNAQNGWQLKLNNEVIYNLSIETGAIDIDYNLSGFKIEKLYIKSGASNIKLIIPQYDSKIVINSGVSNIEITIPQNVGAMLNIDSGITIKDLNNFTKENGVFTSQNYKESTFKTEIEIDCGVSNIEINYINIP